MASSKSDMVVQTLTGCALSSDLRPFAVAFPDPDVERDVDLVRVTVKGTAAFVARKVMGAVDVFRDPELHRSRLKVQAAIKVGLRALDRRDGEELQRPLASLEKLVFLVRLNEQYDAGTQ